MKKIGFLGPRGTFSQEACEKYIQQNNLTLEKIAYNSIHELLLECVSNKINYAIVPIENSLEGGVSTTLDTVAEKNNLKIISEIIIQINQNLLVKKGVCLDDIAQIISHPQPIGQCKSFINSHLPKAIIHFDYSTATAALKVRDSKVPIASIGSKLCAIEYNLDVLYHNIQDNPNNYTRFVVLTSNDFDVNINKARQYKTSIIFSTEDKPGSLYRILDIFSIWDINMSKIESRPTKNWLGNYIFFVDIIGNIEDENVKDALKMVERKSSFYKLLGTYEIAEI